VNLRTRTSSSADGRWPAASARRGRPIAAGLHDGFTLVEIMVVMGLLAVIVLGLLSMFTQTQRAFRVSMTQVDVLEGGRAASGLIAREIEQVTPADENQALNFFAALPLFYTPLASVPYTPFLQTLPGVQPVLGNPPVNPRTNIIEDLFFLKRQNQTWTGIGYRVDTPSLGVGTLYRFETNAFFEQDPAQLFFAFTNTPATNMSRVMDGVVHFKVRAFGPNGIWLATNLTAGVLATNYVSGEVGLYTFRSNAVPACVELELGLLEQRTLARYKAIANAAAQSQFLQGQAAHVHLFRERLSVRNVDPTAYP
jgi:prepilin-type N-terminal cleavage/methylation domain-containing protein